MRGRNVFAGAVVAVALSTKLCEAAPKVDIKIIARPRLEEEIPPVLLPIPSRDPFPAFQGPFVDNLESLPCLHEEREMQEGKAYILDLCLLANVTIEAKIEKTVEVEMEVTDGVEEAPLLADDVAEVPDTTEDGDDAAEKLVNPASEEKKEPEIPTILGIFRGWQIDPISLNYKYMVYDDGDDCLDNDHYSMVVELIPSSNPESDTKLYGLKKTGMCTFKASLLTYVPEGERLAGQGIHTPGVVDISDAEASLPVICGKMKCRYGDISKRVRDISDQIRGVQTTLVKGSVSANTLFTNMTLEASKNTLESATQILEKSLELFNEIEALQQSLTNDFLGREDVAKKEIADQEAKDKKRKEEKKSRQGISAVDYTAEDTVPLQTAKELTGTAPVEDQSKPKKDCQFPKLIEGMQHTGPWRWGNPYSFPHFKGVEAHRAALSVRQEALKKELLRMHQQQLIGARRERHKELRAQVHQLEQQVRQYELKASNPAGTGSAFSNNSLAQFDQRVPGSSETLIAKVVQQNEQIIALLVPQRQGDVQVHAIGIPNTSKASGEVSSPESPPFSKADATCSLSVQNGEHEAVKSLAQKETQREVPIKSHAPIFPPTSALSWLPEFEWTDEDEIALDKLENDADSLLDISGSDDVNVVNSSEHGNSTSANATTSSDAPKDHKARDRLESRKKLEALLSASLKNVGRGALRKPRWRLEAEAERDDISPFGSEAEAMGPLQIFRSAVLSVFFVVNLKEMLMAKKLAEKKSAMRDFESMLRVYFDATRMWLGKVVRTPLLSIIQDASLDVDISTRGGLTGFSLRGFARKFGDILARRPLPTAQSLTNNGQLSESSVDPAKLIKLKVRLRGVLLALSKAIDKKEVPSGILDFWKRISTDGVYFPPSYQLFHEERQSLEFDTLGATRRMNEDLGAKNGNEFSRFNVVLVNFLVVRILIPHVILQPWKVGIGSKNIEKQTAANLATLATLLYCVCRQLSPLPPPVEYSETTFIGRRRSQTVTTAQPTTSDGQSELDSGPGPAELQEVEHCVEISFMSIAEIGHSLISDKNFPSHDLQVVQVVKEHHLMLQETLTRLRSQLHVSQR